MHLEQTMQPGFAPPPPFKRFFRKAMLSKAAQMLVQLQVSPCATSCRITYPQAICSCRCPEAKLYSRCLRVYTTCVYMHPIHACRQCMPKLAEVMFVHC